MCWGNVQDIYVVKGLTKPVLGRSAIQALGIISNVNLSSVDADLVTKKPKATIARDIPTFLRGWGKIGRIQSRYIRMQTVCIVRPAQSSVAAYGQG